MFQLKKNIIRKFENYFDRISRICCERDEKLKLEFEDYFDRIGRINFLKENLKFKFEVCFLNKRWRFSIKLLEQQNPISSISKLFFFKSFFLDLFLKGNAFSLFFAAQCLSWANQVEYEFEDNIPLIIFQCQLWKNSEGKFCFQNIRFGFK